MSKDNKVKQGIGKPYIRRQVKKVKQKTCTICRVTMKRKGKKGDFSYWKCPQCKGTLRYGIFTPSVNKDNKELHEYQLKQKRDAEAKRKFIRNLKYQKYLPFKEIWWAGQLIKLDDYDKHGLLLPKNQRSDKQDET